MAWYKTLSRSVQSPTNRATVDYLSEDVYSTTSSIKNNVHQYTTQNTKGGLHREKSLMGYEDTVRPARKLAVEAAPVFIDALGDRLFLTDYTQTIRIYKTNGKKLASVHAESEHSILSGVGIDKLGKSLYVCDAHANNQARVQIFNIGEEISPVVYLGHGLFKAPHGIAITNDNRAIVTDVERKEIFIIKEDGVNATCFGGSGKRYGQFSFPHGVAYDNEHHRIVISDTHNHRLQVFNDQGNFIECIEFDKNNKRLFSYPTGLKFDQCGNLVVCENGGDSLRILDHQLHPLHHFRLSGMGLRKPTAVATLPFERLCVASREDECLVIF